jgi:cysteine-rich repeat protein
MPTLRFARQSCALTLVLTLGTLTLPYPAPAQGQCPPESEVPCCGNGAVEPGEQCDDGGASASCTGGCTIAPCDASECLLLPIADTFIDRASDTGEPREWDHGGAISLRTSSRDAQTHISYLKFDLGQTRNNIRRATLRLVCIDASPIGGTIYAVPDSGWIEGTCDGLTAACAGGPGLTWEQVDTLGNGEPDGNPLDEPFEPDFGHPGPALDDVCPPGHPNEPYSVDVTSLVQNVQPGPFTLAIASPGRPELRSINPAEYASREHPTASLRPRLLLELEPRCNRNGVRDSFEQCDDGNTVESDGCTTDCTPTKCHTCSSEPCSAIPPDETCVVDVTPACRDLCIPTTCYTCDDSGCSPTPRCGNGCIEAGEECDDGGDSATCDFDCTVVSGSDGYINAVAGEQCDDGNQAPGDGCHQNQIPCCAPGAPGVGTRAPFSRGAPGCERLTCENCVCATNPVCCKIAWEESCVAVAETTCAGACRCGDCPVDAATCDLLPVADTEIRCSDGQRDRDHGHTEVLVVDGPGPASTSERSMVYLKFDLSAITEQVGIAKLKLSHGQNPTDDWGTVYRVPDTTWKEGTCPGDEGCFGEGLKCSEIDTRIPIGEVTSNESPFAPDLSKPLGQLLQVPEIEEDVEADISAADFVAGVHSLAVRNESVDGTDYRSRERSSRVLRPRLRLAFGPPPCGDGRVQPGEECDGGACCVQCRIAATSTTCRVAVGPCDHPETCDGVNAGCPPDVTAAPSGTPCRDARGACDIPETCDGESRQCPPDITFGSPGAPAPPDDCRLCRVDQECREKPYDNPCTMDRCEGPGSGCRSPELMSGAFRAASCALGVQQRTECANPRFPRGQRFVEMINRAKADICESLERACHSARPNAARSALRAARKGLARLDDRVKHAVPLGKIRRGKIDGDCGRELRGRLKLARSQLKSLLDGDPTSLCNEMQGCTSTLATSPGDFD